MRHCLLLAGLFLGAARGEGPLELFVQRIDPVFKRDCRGCHGEGQTLSKLRLRLRDAGRYRVRVDNTLEHRAPARVQLKVEVEYHPPPPEAATIPEARQRAVVVLSLLLFGMIAGWSGRRLLAAARRRSGG